MAQTDGRDRRRPRRRHGVYPGHHCQQARSPFQGPAVGAVAGNTKVGNRINLLTRWQALEYITSQNLDRRAFDVLNCITVVPGAVGAWRRELIESAGGFRHDTLAEDADLTLAIRKLGKRIVYERRGHGPDRSARYRARLHRQRYRWMYGTMQAAWKHRDVLFRRRYGALGFVALPNVIVFPGALSADLADHGPAVDRLAGIGRLQSLAPPGGVFPDNLWRVLFYYALFVSVDYLAAILAFALERKESWGLLIWLFWQRFFYRQLMYYVAIKSTMTSLKGVLVAGARSTARRPVQRAREVSIDPLRLEHRNRSGHNPVLFTRRVAGAMNAQKASTLLEKAAQALRGHGLMVSVQKQDGSEEGRWRAATCLGVRKDRCGTDYAAEVRGKVTSDSLGAMVTQLRQPVDVGDPPLLLITDHVTRPVAHRLREQEQQFADTAGNAYLEARGSFRLCQWAET
jgi:hypothetical protein